MLEKPRIAIYTLTRDRLDYTKRFFNQLKETVGIEYDHFVVDNGSVDGTQDFLKEKNLKELILFPENRGIFEGINELLKRTDFFKGYDYVIKIDNDIEFECNGWLEMLIAAKELALFSILSPNVIGVGLNPRTSKVKKGSWDYGIVAHVGGACLLTTPSVYLSNGFGTGNMAQGWDTWFCKNRLCAYVENINVKHDTNKQKRDKPEYYNRKCLEANKIYKKL